MGTQRTNWGTAQEQTVASPKRGPKDFSSLADWVASPEFAELAALARSGAVERKRNKRKAYAQRYYARTRDSLPVKPLEYCKAVFGVPSVPLLPAPKQVVRWPAETIYSPIKAKASTPSRYRPEHRRPQWQLDAERTIVATRQEFAYLVKALDMTAEDCASYLRVSVATVRAWESGNEAIPFSAFWLLRLTIERGRFKDRFPEWDGWVVAEAGPDAGKLIDPARTYAFTPQEIACIPKAWSQASFHSLRADKLQAHLDAAEAENLRLRKAFAAQGVTAELRKMHDQIGPLQARLSALLSSIGTADVIEHKPASARPKVRKAA